jgi:hypothetical protein
MIPSPYEERASKVSYGVEKFKRVKINEMRVEYTEVFKLLYPT